MNILAIDTATVLCSAALQTDKQLVRRDAVISGKHSTLIFQQIEQVLAEAGITRDELNAVILSAGPGSFTGLRVGSSAVKGFLFGSDVALYAGSTLAGYALSVVSEDFEGRVHAIIDARRQHVYTASYQISPSGITEVHSSGIVPISELSERFSPGDVLAGTGIERLPAGVTDGLQVFGADRLSAAGLLRLLRSSGDFYGGVLQTISEGVEGAEGGLIRKVNVAEFEPEYLSEGGLW
jgi:tRNA threonylcarbamoyladenosine biosynthesis protein TsaB